MRINLPFGNFSSSALRVISERIAFSEINFTYKFGGLSAEKPKKPKKKINNDDLKQDSGNNNNNN
jgi:hypothetical protein